MITFLDGAFGTEIQKRGLQPGEIPETWNITHPDAVRDVHRAYFEAGADIVLANTFGANPAKYHGTQPLADVVSAALVLARSVAPKGKRIALDIGPTGRLLKPAGDFAFDDAYAAFAETVRIGAGEGADLIAVETFNDTYELKAAILAARENSSLPVYATVALNADGKLLTGGDVDCLAALLNGLRPDAVGFNCGVGPDLLVPLVRRLRTLTDLPIIVKPNAGLPKVVDGKTCFTVSPADFARDVAACVKAGATIVGGCCGTTPDYIAALKDALTGIEETYEPTSFRRPCAVSSFSRCITLPDDDSIVIGERINPTGKKNLKEAYRTGDTSYILREALAQVEAGAAILDVNAGVPGLDESAVLRNTVEAIQGVTDTPLQIDTSDPIALENALRHYNGKPLVNSVNGKRESMDAVFPLVAKYGGVVVALTLDENGIPPTAEGRLAIARRILARGRDFGLTPDDFLVDVLCLAVSAEPQSVNVILESMRRIRAELGVRTALGVSNVSFGLPARPQLNAAFYTLALEAGLSAAIVNPLSSEMMTARRAWRALTARDAGCGEWITAATASTAETSNGPLQQQTLQEAILHGLKSDAGTLASEALQGGQTPVDVIDRQIVPALETVGRGFETGTTFLPQLLMAAEAAAAAFEVLKARLAESGTAAEPRGPIIIATVKGDIHDIGKNIVRALLENYGFRVIDLGRDVPPEKIVEAAKANACRLVGLSALMTTTVGFMEETIRLLSKEAPDVKTFVGGAVLTADYAARIGATWYARDAMAAVRTAEAFFS